MRYIYHKFVSYTLPDTFCFYYLPLILNEDNLQLKFLSPVVKTEDIAQIINVMIY
jgi:hypothetical protein